MISIPSTRNIDHEAFAESCMRFSSEAAIRWVRENMTPEHIYSYDALEQWALENGFERKNPVAE